MPKTRENALTPILLKAGYRLSTQDNPNRSQRASTSRMPLSAAAAIDGLLLQMAGRKLNHSQYVTAGDWDIVLEDGLIVELDEDAHFNRYREQTLNATWAREMPWAHSYLNYCQDFEDVCLRGASWSNYWESPGSRKMFGASDPPGILCERGSSRWKQRALYEAVRDAMVLHTPGLSLARISVHDVIAGQSVNQVLYGEGVFTPGALREFIESRTLRGGQP